MFQWGAAIASISLTLSYARQVRIQLERCRKPFLLAYFLRHGPRSDNRNKLFHSRLILLLNGICTEDITCASFFLVERCSSGQDVIIVSSHCSRYCD